jgi:type 1 fimbriae regulatory protein FimB/type 1 fimbriae regulatory protein FimE
VLRAFRSGLRLFTLARLAFARRSHNAAHSARIAEAAKRPESSFSVHPHMLRHATGFYLANAGQDTRAIQLYLGHKNIQHTVRYTELAVGRFKDFWRD